MNYTKNIFIASIVILFFLIFIVNSVEQGFFFIIILAVIGYFYYLQYQKINKTTNTTSSLMETLEKELSDKHELSDTNIYPVHKTPKNIRFLKKNEEFQQILYDLKFLKIYDNALYNKLTSLIEYFLKIHFKIMIKKYDFDLWYPVLKDIRAEILNTMKSIYLNIPNVSTILYIKDLDVYLEKRIRIVQAITYRFIKIVCHKYNKSYKPPHEVDFTQDSHYALF